MNPLIIAILILVAVLLVLLFFYCELREQHRELMGVTNPQNETWINYQSERNAYRTAIRAAFSHDSDADKRRAELLDALNSTPARLDR